jgi:hypothetical protein
MQICSPPGVAKLAGYQPFAAACFAARARKATFKTSRLTIICISMIVDCCSVLLLCFAFGVGAVDYQREMMTSVRFMGG